MTPPATSISALFAIAPPVLTLEGRVTLLPLLDEALADVAAAEVLLDPLDPPRAWLQMVIAALFASIGNVSVSNVLDVEHKTY